MLMRFYHKESGFTLAEMIAAMAIFSIIVFIAYPHFLDSRAKMLMASSSNMLISIVRFAQGEALEENRVEHLVFKNNGKDIIASFYGKQKIIHGINLRNTQKVHIVFYSDGSSSGGDIPIQSTLNPNFQATWHVSAAGEVWKL